MTKNKICQERTFYNVFSTSPREVPKPFEEGRSQVPLCPCPSWKITLLQVEEVFSELYQILLSTTALTPLAVVFK